MSTLVSFNNLLPKSVIDAGINEITDRKEIDAALASRTIISPDRFNLKPGVYKFVSVRAATWTIGTGRAKKEAVMCLLTLKDAEGKEHETTIGSLRKIDSNLKNYGPSEMPVNESELLHEIETRGIEITEIKETTATKFVDGAPEKDEHGKLVTRPTKIMSWKFANAA